MAGKTLNYFKFYSNFKFFTFSLLIHCLFSFIILLNLLLFNCLIIIVCYFIKLFYLCFLN